MKIGIVEKNQAPYWEILNQGFRVAASRLNVEIQIWAPPEENIDAQYEMMQEAIKQCDAIGYVATRPGFFAELSQSALQQGKPVVTFDLDDGPESGRYLYIGTSAYANLGALAGREMVRLLPHGGKVAVQSGSRTAQGARAKLEGFINEVTSAGLKPLEVEFDRESPEESYANAVKLLKAHPDIKGMFGGYAYHGPTQCQALTDLGLESEVKVVGFDVLPEAVPFLSKGVLDTTFWIQEYYFGYLTAVILHSFVVHGMKETLMMLGMDNSQRGGNVIEIPVKRVTAENVDLWVKWAREQGLTQF